MPEAQCKPLQQKRFSGPSKGSEMTQNKDD